MSPRNSKCITLRVKDIDFDQRRVFVRSGKGDKDRSTLLPQALVEPLKAHLARVKALHEADLAQGHGEIRLPNALGRKTTMIYTHPPTPSLRRTSVMRQNAPAVRSPLDAAVA